MNNGINLLIIPGRSKNFKPRILLFYRIISVSLLLSVMISILVLFWLQFVSPIRALRNEERILRNNLLLLAKKKTKYEIVLDRLRQTNKILDTRSDFSQIIEILKSKFPAGITISGVFLGRSSASVSISSTSLRDIGEAYENMIQLAGARSEFGKIILREFNLNALSGKYSLSFDTKSI